MPTEGTWCKNSRAVLYTHSRHPGGNPFDRFYEQNRGISFECSSDTSGEKRILAGGIPNSRDGTAVFFGKGWYWDSPEFYRLSLGIGSEIVVMYYEIRDEVGYRRVLNRVPRELYRSLDKKLAKIPDRGYLISPVPIGVFRVRFRLWNDWGYVSFEERRLADKANLYGIGWSRSF
jgi:hypothetical protein